MATNRLPGNIDRLIMLAEDMADGLKVQEAQIGLKQNTEAAMRTDAAAATAARDAYNQALHDNTALKAAQAAADLNAKTFLVTARDVLTHFLGKQWSPSWLPAGFTNRTLAVPGAPAKRQALLQTLHAYLEANPDKQNAPLNVVSTRAGDLFTALRDSRAAVSGSGHVVGSAKAARDEAEKALRIRMNGLIAELGQLLGKDDPAWFAFALNRPGDPEMPGIPDNVILTAGQPGSIHVTWAPAPRAIRYRVYKKDEGDADYAAVVTSNDQQATITGLRSGGSVEIQVSAANRAGESKPCSPVQILVPAAPVVQAQP